jgi:hypothetical protein
MADLVIAAASVRAIERPGHRNKIISLPTEEALVAGQWARIDPTTGKATAGKATAAPEARPGGIVLRTPEAIGGTVEIITEGLVSVGNALSGLAYDAAVYLSDTDATLADGTGTVTYEVGRVFPVFGAGAGVPDKVLELYGKGN